MALPAFACCTPAGRPCGSRLTSLLQVWIRSQLIWDRRTDTQSSHRPCRAYYIPYRFRPCCAYYAHSANNSVAVSVDECLDVRYMHGDRQTDRWTQDNFIDPATHTVHTMPLTLWLSQLISAWMSDTCSGTDRQTDRQMDT